MSDFEVRLDCSCEEAVQLTTDTLVRHSFKVSRTFDLAPTDYHGGYFPYRLQAPIADSVFRVGDAAGQCMPLTGKEFDRLFTLAWPPGDWSAASWMTSCHWNRP
jgi:hypothetical protein